MGTFFEFNNNVTDILNSDLTKLTKEDIFHAGDLGKGEFRGADLLGAASGILSKCGAEDVGNNDYITKPAAVEAQGIGANLNDYKTQAMEIS